MFRSIIMPVTRYLKQEDNVCHYNLNPKLEKKNVIEHYNFSAVSRTFLGIPVFPGHTVANILAISLELQRLFLGAQVLWISYGLLFN